MNINKAIEILSIYMKGSDEAEPVDFDHALTLGIEALKRIRSGRKTPLGLSFNPLSSETEE